MSHRCCRKQHCHRSLRVWRCCEQRSMLLRSIVVWATRGDQPVKKISVQRQFKATHNRNNHRGTPGLFWKLVGRLRCYITTNYHLYYVTYGKHSAPKLLYFASNNTRQRKCAKAGQNSSKYGFLLGPLTTLNRCLLYWFLIPSMYG